MVHHFVRGDGPSTWRDPQLPAPFGVPPALLNLQTRALVRWAPPWWAGRSAEFGKRRRAHRPGTTTASWRVRGAGAVAARAGAGAGPSGPNHGATGAQQAAAR